MQALKNMITKLRKTKLVYIGFALYLAFRFFYIHDAAPLIGEAGLGSEYLMWYLTVLVATKFLVFIVCAGIAYKNPSIGGNVLSVAAAILLALGMTFSIILLRTTSFHFGASETLLLLLISSILLGIGDALMLLLWSRFTSALSTTATFLFILVSYVIGLSIYIVIINLPPIALIISAIVVSMLLPLLLSKSMSHHNLYEAIQPNKKVMKKTVSIVWKPIFLASLFAFLSSFTLLISGQQTVDATQAHITSTVITLVVVLTMLVVGLFSPKKIDLDLSYRIALPLAAGGLLLLAYLWNFGGGIANSMVAMGWLLADIALWCVLANTAARLKVSAFLLFGASQAISCVATVVGILGGYYFANSVGYDTIAIMTAALIGIYLLSTTLVFLLKNRHGSATIAATVNEKARTSKEESELPEASTEVTAYIVEDRVQARVRGISEQSDLTSRETDILGFLAQGRSTQYMAENLFLSENTVKSHVKNVYRKLGVHSKQEVIDIINSEVPTSEPE